MELLILVFDKADIIIKQRDCIVIDIDQGADKENFITEVYKNS